MDTVNCTVIGGGVIGLAIAARLSENRPVMLLEAGKQLGQGVSSRNSEVIHSGIYYPEDSLKARFCLEGRERLYAFCESFKVPYQKTGKLVVAQKNELSALENLYQQAQQNGVVNCELLDQEFIAKSEPGLRASAALFCPDSGIVDSQQLMLALAGVVSAKGSDIALDSEVTEISATQNQYQLTLQSGYQFCTEQLIVAAGLESWALMETLVNQSESSWQVPERYLAKGHYFSYAGPSPFKHLIYPMPDKAGLGIHATLDLAGQLKFGPDVEFVEQLDWNFPQDIKNLKEKFVQAITRYFPELDDNKLQPAYCGIRPKLQSPNDRFADFLLAGESRHGLSGVVACLGIESPGLTSALAIAENIKQQLD